MKRQYLTCSFIIEIFLDLSFSRMPSPLVGGATPLRLFFTPGPLAPTHNGHNGLYKMGKAPWVGCWKNLQTIFFVDFTSSNDEIWCQLSRSSLGTISNCGVLFFSINWGWMSEHCSTFCIGTGLSLPNKYFHNLCKQCASIIQYDWMSYHCSSVKVLPCQKEPGVDAYHSVWAMMGE